jgi:leucyl aminopeptidase
MLRHCIRCFYPSLSIHTTRAFNSHCVRSVLPVFPPPTRALSTVTINRVHQRIPSRSIIRAMSSQVATVPDIRVLPADAGLGALKEGASADALLVLYTERERLLQHSLLQQAGAAQLIQAFAKIDAGFDKQVQLVPCEAAPGGKLVLACTGSLSGDVDDVRRFADAAASALKRARQAGTRRPAITVVDAPTLPGYERYLEVTLLSVLHEAYVPLQVRELQPSSIDEAVEAVTVIPPAGANKADLARTVRALEAGRRVARDLGASDPERMAPPRFADYVVEAFAPFKDVINVSVISDQQEISRSYPLLAAVARCSQAVERHRPRVVRIDYRASDQTKVKEHLYLVGKGVTYDTGGADVKAGGVMRGMSRDKCGAAGVAGFLRTVAELRPAHLNVTAFLALVRNSIGADAYVSDEIIRARSGCRVLVGNTDAEGRMAMTDLLCQAREEVLAARAAAGQTPVPKATLFTVATLTGHVIRAYGHYGAAVPNGPAYCEAGTHQRLIAAGDRWGDPFELSRLRREDMDLGRGHCGTADIVSSNSRPSTMTNRGHMFPAAFMIIASGLEKHGLDQPDPSMRIPYTHLDIAGSAEEEHASGLCLPRTTGSPILPLAGAYLLDQN